MSLKNNPIRPVEISVLDVKWETTDIQRELAQRTNVAIYVAGALCLAHGRRDLLPVTVVWAKALHCAHLLHPCDKPTVEWLGYLLNKLREWCFNLDIETTLALRFGGEPTLNLLERLSSAIYKLGEASEDNVPDLTGLLGLDREENNLVLGFISRCYTTATSVSGECQRAAATISAGGDAATVNISLGSAKMTLIENFGGSFDYLPAKVVNTYLALNGKCKMEDVWAKASDTFCLSATRVTLVEPDPDEPRESRRNRRWLNGSAEGEDYESRERVISQSIDEALSCTTGVIQRKGLTIDFGRLSGAMGMVKDYACSELDNFVPMTFMTPESFALFDKSGTTTTIWELSKRKDFEKTWHHRYSDVPLHGRAITDRRLYGERGTHLTYGALIHRGMVGHMEILAGMYGSVAVTWKRDALRYATLCVGDSQTSPFVLPATRLMVTKAVVAFMTPHLLNLEDCNVLSCAVSEALMGNWCHPNLIECQMHDHMSTSDVSDAVDFA
jgi:hypothetical protein